MTAPTIELLFLFSPTKNCIHEMTVSRRKRNKRQAQSHTYIFREYEINFFPFRAEQVYLSFPPHNSLVFFLKKKTWPIFKSCLFCVEIYFFLDSEFLHLFFFFFLLYCQNKIVSLFKIFLDFLDKTNGIMKWYECVGNDFGVFRVRPQCSSQ